MQGKDNLEQFIREHRSSFDTKDPSSKVWDSIGQELARGDSPRNTLWYWKAAVFLLIGAVGFLLVDKFAGTAIPSIDESTLASEVSNLEKFQELEIFYTSIITEKSGKLNEELQDDEHFNHLEVDMKVLDELYADLKEVFLQSQQSEEVLNRLIHVLRQKIHLLNSQLDILEDEMLPEEMRAEPGISM